MRRTAAAGCGFAARLAVPCAAATSCSTTSATRCTSQPGETTPDGRVTLEFAECLGACEHAPCMLANDDLHKSVSHEQADQFVKALP